MRPKSLFFPLLFLMIYGCNIRNGANIPYFQVKDAFYQSWVLSENEKGTNIILKMEKVDKNIVFDSLIFRGVMLKVSISFENDQVILKSVLPVGITRIETKNKLVQKPDQLLYKYFGTKGFYPLKNIRREKGKYF